jgi:hypothetical protein
LLIIGLALLVSSAQAKQRASAAAVGCTTLTVSYGHGFGSVTYRFVLQGRVSCSEAQRTMRSYAHAITQGRCPTRICTQVTFPGGWTCSSSSAVEIKQGAALAGCGRRGASFRVYKASPGGPPGAEQSVQFRSADDQIWCGANVAGPGTLFFCASPRPGGRGQHSATLYSDGHVAFCNVAVATLSKACYDNWGAGTPFLGLGKQNYINGVLCKYATAGMTCTLTGGRGKGRGFRINKNGAVQLG